MPTMTINMSAPTFGGVKKDYAFSGTISLPQVITQPISIQSASLYFGWARCYYKNNYIGITIGGTHFYSEKFTAANDDTLRERTVSLVCDNVGTDHLLNVQGRTVSYVIKNDSSSGTGNVIDRPRAGDMVLTINYTILESASTLSLQSTVIEALQNIVPVVNVGVGATSHLIRYQFGSDIRDISNTNAFPTPDAWMQQIPSSTSGTGSATLYTYNSAGTQIGNPSTVYFTLTVPVSIVPTISSFVATRTNNTVPAAWDVYVQGKSGVTLTGVAAGAYGSYIVSWSITGDGKSATSNSLWIPLISGNGNIPFNITVTDSRGRTASKSTSINAVPYFSPGVQSLAVSRCDVNGALNPNGMYGLVSIVANFAPVSSKNACKMALKCRPSGGAWDYAVSDVPLANGSATGRLIGGWFTPTSSYEIEATISDAFGSVPASYATVGTATCYEDKLIGQNKLGLFAYVPQGIPEKSIYLPSDGKLYFGDLQVTDLFSNPNLLRNGDFRFWQRGFNLAGPGYGADRWFISSDAQMWRDGNMGVVRFSSGVWNNLAQFVEHPSRLAGKTLTVSLSIYWTQTPVYLVVDIYDAGSNRTILLSENYGVVGGKRSATFTVPSNVTDNHLMIVRLFQDVGYTNVMMALEYIKLEIGNVATPYHPSPGEMSDCYRYYVGYDPDSLWHQLIHVYGQSAMLYLPLPTQMRLSSPSTLFTSPQVYSSVTNTWQPVTWLDTVVSGLIAKVRFDTHGHTQFGDVRLFRGLKGLDAEIYQ